MNKLLILPLDERPCNYDYFQFLNNDEHVEVILPDASLMGRKKRPADIDKLQDWLLKESFRATHLILSVDMLVYGGLIPSRLHHFSYEELMSKLDVIKNLKNANPNLVIYADVMIMRNPNYSSSDEEPDYYESWGKEIHRLGVLTHKNELAMLTDEEQRERESLIGNIPEEFWKDYLNRREINLKINKRVLDLCQEGFIDYLVIPQDDSSPYGLTKMDQQCVKKEIEKRHLDEHVMIYPGADEVAISLMARVYTDIYRYHPKIYVTYRYEESKNLIPLYEDRSLYLSVASQLKNAGACVVEKLDEADLVLYINNPKEMFQDILNHRDYHRSMTTEGFVKIRKLIKSGYPLGIADVAFANGADMTMIEWLKLENILFDIESYAGWNTSSNTLGTVIGVLISDYFKKKNNKFHQRNKNTWLAMRYIEDGLYQSIIRLEVTQELAKYGYDYFNVGEKEGIIADLIQKRIKEHVHNLLQNERYRCRKLSCSLPWKRMFEANIDVELESKETVIGIDIGGTNLKGALVDFDGYFSCVTKVPTYATEGADIILKQMHKLYTILKEQADQKKCVIQGVGIGTAGRVDVHLGKVVYATDNLPGWNGLDLKTRLSKFIDFPIVIDNDANVALLGEMWIGAAQQMESAVMLTLGTGVGGAIYVNGDILRGAYYEGAELGHAILYPDGKKCNCGKYGCVEQYLSGKALVNKAKEDIDEAIVHGQQVFERYDAGDIKAKKVVDDFIKDLRLALVQINSFINPQVIIIGGGVIHSAPIWWNRLIDVFNETELKKASLDNDAGFVGSARLMWESLEKGSYYE